MHIKDIIILANSSKASDIFLSSAKKLALKIDGQVVYMDFILSADVCLRIFEEISSAHARIQFKEKKQCDFSVSIFKSRFRVSCFEHSNGICMTMRPIPSRIPSMSELGMGDVFKKIVQFKSGLVLITGATGSGKSTTLASMIEHINISDEKHIITLEDPIEFEITSKSSLVHQRQVGQDTISFSESLRSILRNSPDIIVVGELRDVETLRAALVAAETGHLVFGTLHTYSAAQTIVRILSSFPAEEQDMLRTMLSGSLRAIITQQLLKKISKQGGRVAAREILLSNLAVSNMIKEDKIRQIVSVIQSGRSEGMTTMEWSIEQLKQKRIIE